MQQLLRIEISYYLQYFGDLLLLFLFFIHSDELIYELPPELFYEDDILINQ